MINDFLLPALQALTPCRDKYIGIVRLFQGFEGHKDDLDFGRLLVAIGKQDPEKIW